MLSLNLAELCSNKQNKKSSPDLWYISRYQHAVGTKPTVTGGAQQHAVMCHFHHEDTADQKKHLKSTDHSTV